MKRISAGNLPVTLPDRRRGAISAMAVVVLVVVSLLVTQYVRRTLEDRRFTRKEVDRLQAESLADAGVGIARTSLKADPSWVGTTWELPKGAISKTKTGRVTISVENGIFSVIARFPADSITPVQITRRGNVAELTR